MGIFDSIFGGSKTQTTKNPAWYDTAAQSAVGIGQKGADLGYVPNMGPDIAGFNPMQRQAMQQVSDRFSAFNNPGGTPAQVDEMPQTDFGGGMHGYSSYGGWQAQVAALEKAYPGIAAQLKAFSKSPFGAVGAPQPPMVGGPGSTPLGPPGPAVQPPAPGTTPPTTTPVNGVPADWLTRHPKWTARHPGVDLATWYAARHPTVATNLGLGGHP